MLVSAVNANLFQSKKIVESTNTKNNPVSTEENADTVFNSLPNSSKKATGVEKKRLYDSINEWKFFCHKQILNGKFDVIA